MPGAETDLGRHFVTIEMRHLATMRGMERAEDQTDPIKLLRLKARGWRELRCPCHQQEAVDRVICMDCLNDNAIADKVHAQYRRDAARLERPTTDDKNFYLTLCDG